MLRRKAAYAALFLGLVLGVAASVYVGDADATRNSSGNYSLATGNPVVSGTPVSSTWANATLTDLATEITNSLDRSGRGAMLAPLQCTNGSAALPSLTFGSDTNTGLYRIAADNIGLTLGGTKYVDFGATVTGFTGAITATAGITVTQSTTNGAGATATGNGSGNGVTATGGSSGAGVVATGGATGAGVTATGNNGIVATSTVGQGIISTGFGIFEGVKGTGGATSGPGVVGIGGAPNGHGASFTGTGSGYAIQVGTGDARFAGNNPASTTGYNSTVTPMNIVKAWALVTLTAGSPVVTAGFNITSVSCGSQVVTVTIATDMASAAYGSIATSNGFASVPGLWFEPAPGSGTIDLYAYRWTAGGGGSVGQFDLCAAGATGKFTVLIIGAQ